MTVARTSVRTWLRRGFGRNREPTTPDPPPATIEVWVATSDQRPPMDLDAPAWRRLGGLDTAFEDDARKLLHGEWGFRAPEKRESVDCYVDVAPSDDQVLHAIVDGRTPAVPFWLALVWHVPRSPRLYFAQAPAGTTSLLRQPPQVSPHSPRVTPVAVRLRRGSTGYFDVRPGSVEEGWRTDRQDPEPPDDVSDAADLHLVYLRDAVLIERRVDHDWRAIQDEYDDFRTSLGPWDLDGVINFLIDDWTDADVALGRLRRFCRSGVDRADLTRDEP